MMVYRQPIEWCDDWRTELQKTNYGCYERLCECRNTINDVVLMARLMWQYNPHMTKSDCLDRMIEWCGDWNNQFELMEKMCTEYKKYLKKI